MYMMQTQEVFQRYEKKYMITVKQLNILLSNLKKYMTADQYGKHTICNIYFDTENYELIRTSIEKPVYKEKVRLRSYGIPGENDIVYLELKKKFDGIVYKRRIPIKLNDAKSYLHYGKKPKAEETQERQITNELDYTIQKYNLEPAVYLSYERVALYGNEDENLRVTFDYNICGRDTMLSLEQGNYGTLLLNEEKALMEVKIPGAMPLWMSHMFSELKIFPISYSKYGEYYKQYICQKHVTRGGIHCA